MMPRYRWYRGKIREVCDNDEYDVIFVDTGESEIVKFEDLLPLPTQFHQPPFQAIECSLRAIESIGKRHDYSCIYTMIYHMYHVS